MKKKVTIYTTAGVKDKVVETEATNWGGLQADLKRDNVNFNNMKAVEGNTRVTLESPQAQLPEGDFILFLMTKKNKSGAIDPKTMTYAELKSTIRDILAGFKGKDLDKAKKFFANKEKNYTQTGTDYMRKRLLAWIKKHGTKSIPRTGTTAKAKAVPAKKEAPKKETAKKEAPKKESTPFVKIIAEIDALRESKDYTADEKNALDKIYGDLNELSQGVSARIQKEAEEAAAKEQVLKEAKAKVDKAEKDLRDLTREFNDVNNY